MSYAEFLYWALNWNTSTINPVANTPTTTPHAPIIVLVPAEGPPATLGPSKQDPRQPHLPGMPGPPVPGTPAGPRRMTAFGGNDPWREWIGI